MRPGAVRVLRASAVVSADALLLGVAAIAPLPFSAAAQIAGDGVNDPCCGRPASTW